MRSGRNLVWRLGAVLQPSVTAVEGRCHGVRGFSSKEQPSMKQYLRELFKRVHPDLFHAHPVAREANEKSFKILQEYLSESRSGGSFQGVAGVPYRFVFYLHNRQEEGATPHQSQDDNDPPPDGLHRVKVTLPPPGQLSRLHGTSQLSPAAEKAVGSLLAACGLQNRFAEAADGRGGMYEGRAGQIFTAEKLRDFVPEAAELLRQNEGSRSQPRNHLSAARTALRMGRQVTAEFVGVARGKPAEEKAGMLQRLAQALDRTPEEVRGLHFVLGGSYGMDAHGNLLLDHADDALHWTGFLLQADLKACREAQEAARQLRQREVEVAASCGLPLIFTQPHLTLSPAYEAFLARMAVGTAERGPIFEPAEREVALQVNESRSQQEASISGAAGDQGYAIDEQKGVILVPLDGGVDQIYRFCRKHGPHLAAAIRRRKAEMADLEHLRHQTERRMRLRRLVFDHSLPDAHLKSCCVRLTKASEQLRNMFDGLSVRISHLNQVSPDSNCIDIAWDFGV